MRRTACLVLLTLGACAQVPPAPDPPAATAVPDISGDYSNFGQAFAADAPETTWDLRIRPLPGHADRAFLVTRTYRETGESQTRLYQFDPVAGGGLELRIALLTEGQDDLDSDALLNWAKGQFDPGCVLDMVQSPAGWRGRTKPETCRLEHPLEGEFGVLQEIELQAERVNIEIRLSGPDGAEVSQSIQEFDRVHEYRAWAGLRRFDADGNTSELVHSDTVLLRSDGRRQRLSEHQGPPMEISLQMTLLEWQPGEPDYLRLDVYEPESGALMGYYWARPDAANIELNSDWLQVWAERLPAQPVE